MCLVEGARKARNERAVCVAGLMGNSQVQVKLVDMLDVVGACFGCVVLIEVGGFAESERK